MSPRFGQPVFGLGSLHHLPTHGSRQRLLREALAVGFRAFDLAPAYGNGLNEIELGIALRGNSEARVTTKFGIPVDLYGERHPHAAYLIRAARRLLSRGYGSEYGRRIFSAREMTASLEGSLRRLKRDYVDIFLIHEPLGELDGLLRSELNEAADRLRRAGKIRKWGVAGPTTAIRGLLNDPATEVVQAPLDDISGLDAAGRHFIAYNVYTAYRHHRPSEAKDFAEFARAQMKQGVDVIVSTRRRETLASFRALFA